MSATTLNLYEIGVLNYSKVKKRTNTVVLSGDREKYPMTYAESGTSAKNKIDVKPQAFLRTIFRKAKDQSRAMRMGAKLGTVQYCRKVDASYYFQKIEYLNLNQQPPTVEIRNEDLFVLNAQGELTVAQERTKGELEKKYEIEIQY